MKKKYSPLSNAQLPASLEVLTALEASMTLPWAKTYMAEYKKTGRVFCAPKFVKNNGKTRSDRVADQVFGFHFTSASWPWPKSSKNVFLTPLVQLDLLNAGALLGANLGDGLLQVWFDEIAQECQLRVIPASDLDEDLDVFFPDQAPWLDAVPTFPLGINKNGWHGVKWQAAGVMYPIVSRCFSDFRKSLFGPDVEDGEIDWCNASEYLDEYLMKTGICIDPGIKHQSRDQLYLGGYLFLYGNESGRDEWPKNLEAKNFGMATNTLFHLQGSNAFCNVTVRYREDAAGKVTFECSMMNNY